MCSTNVVSWYISSGNCCRLSIPNVVQSWPLVAWPCLAHRSPSCHGPPEVAKRSTSMVLTASPKAEGLPSPDSSTAFGTVIRTQLCHGCVPGSLLSKALWLGQGLCALIWPTRERERSVHAAETHAGITNSSCTKVVTTTSAGVPRSQQGAGAVIGVIIQQKLTSRPGFSVGSSHWMQQYHWLGLGSAVWQDLKYSLS